MTSPSWTDRWEAVIGLEVHAQLLTHSKLFSRESASFGAPPNTHVNEVCAGLPGALPVINRHAVLLAMKAGFALHCDVNLWSQFARKNYFYPDLPKGYQISQFEHPICTGGRVEYPLEDSIQSCALTRIHMEEDAGKSTHSGSSSLVDLNRAGTPLIEIVSEPDLRSSAEATAFLKELRNILRTIGVCDGNLEQGSFRCDANVSVRPRGQTTLGTRTELKNINSFRFVARAIDYEILRHIDILEDGGQITQETRLFNHDTGKTQSMRSKEEAHDYRYFPDPDLPPLIITPEEAQHAKDSLPELPASRRKRYTQTLNLSLYDTHVLTQSRHVAEFFDRAVAIHPDNPKGIANWVMNDVLREAQNPEESLDDLAFSPESIGELVSLIDSGELTSKIARKVFDDMIKTGNSPTAIADAKNLRPIRDPAKLQTIIDSVIADNPQQTQQFREGKTSLLGYFIGQIMRKTGGKADPKTTQKLLQATLNSHPTSAPNS